MTIQDKLTGANFGNLHHFEDVDDAGDEYSYSPCENSFTVSSHGSQTSIQAIVIGENLVTFEVNLTLKLPLGLTSDRKSRSSETVDLPIKSQITLFRNQPGLFIETEIDNQAEDHKLSVIFPTDLNPTQTFVDQAYLVLPRDIDLPDSTGWVEDPTHLMHQRAFTSLQEDGYGLAILNRGLPAVEVTRIQDGTQISLILLRSVGWLSRDDLPTRRVAAGPLVPTPGAQCIGKYKFEYAILPHAGDWREIYQQAYAYTSPLLVVRADTHEGLDLKEMNITRDDPALVKSIDWPREGRNPDRLSFLTVDNPELVISALKRSRDEQNLIVRLYNISPETLSSRIKTSKPIEEAWFVNLNEERQEQIQLLDESSINIQTRGHQIITLELQMVNE